jgi:predicted cytidylate kinase
MKYSKITISGKICTGKTTLLKHLEKKLNWPTFMTGQLFRDYVKKHGLNLEGAEEQNDQLTKEVDNKVRDMLHEDNKNLIVDGWMSGISANQRADVLKILLDCKDDIRYKRFAKREKMTYDAAKQKVDERQGSWFSKIVKIHKIDAAEFTKNGNYTLVIDTSYITPQAVMKKVLDALK